MRIAWTMKGTHEGCPYEARFANSHTSSSIPSVNRPVNVFCWLGW